MSDVDFNVKSRGFILSTSVNINEDVITALSNHHSMSCGSCRLAKNSYSSAPCSVALKAVEAATKQAKAAVIDHPRWIGGFSDLAISASL